MFYEDKEIKQALERFNQLSEEEKELKIQSALFHLEELDVLSQLGVQIPLRKAERAVRVARDLLQLSMKK